MKASRGRTWLAVLLALACQSKTQQVPAAAATNAYDVVVKGATCHQGGSGTYAETQMVCEYSVGDGLHFSIVSVGAADAGIVFDEILPNSPYRASMAVRHGCVIVEPRPGKDPLKVPEFAFVSPRTGKVYRTWQDCAAAV